MAPAFVTSSFLATGATLRREKTGTWYHGSWQLSMWPVAPSYGVRFAPLPRRVWHLLAVRSPREPPKQILTDWATVALSSAWPVFYVPALNGPTCFLFQASRA